jgi:hypothetical protein
MMGFRNDRLSTSGVQADEHHESTAKKRFAPVILPEAVACVAF